jgi:MFS family permease
VLLAISVARIVSLFGINFNVLVPAYTQGMLGLGADGYGFLMSAAGVGSLLAALLIAFRGRPRPGLLLGGAFLLGAAEIGIAEVHAFAPAALLLFLCGAGSITMSATANTLIQLAVPDALRGRVMAIYTTVFNGSTPIGGPLVGGIASAWSPSLAFGVSGPISAGTALAAVAWRRALPASGSGQARCRLPGAGR